MSDADEIRLYVARGIGGKSFDPLQIEAGLALNLQPELRLGPMATDEMFRDFVSYIDAHPEISFEFVDVKGYPFGEREMLGKSIDTIVAINKALRRPRIKHVAFQGGSVQPYEEKRHHIIGGFLPEEAAFTLRDYRNALEKAIENVRQLKAQAQENGLTLGIENVYPADYDQVASMDLKPEELQKADLRFGNTVWMPRINQRGPLGVVHDLKSFGLDVCLDIEHLEGAIEYSQQFNLQNRGRAIREMIQEETDFLNRYGIFVREGAPILYKEPIDRKRAIQRMGKIPIAHLAGEVSMVLYDIHNGKKVPIIGSHMPITSPGEENEFIADPQLRREVAEKGMRNLREYLSILVERGTRNFSLEPHLGEYTGERWNKYVKMSRDNVQRVLADVKRAA